MKKDQLLDILDKIKPGISENDKSEGTNLVTFEDDRIYSFNKEILISYPFSFDITGSIPAIELHKLLKKIKDTELSISSESNQMIIKGKNKKIGINFVERKSFRFDVLSNIQDKNKEWEQLPENFINALKFCMFSTSIDPTSEDLTCISVQDSVVLSCDNFRATKYTMDNESSNNLDLLIPLKAVKELIKYNPEMVSIDNSWIHFKDENGLLFSCLTMERKHLKNINSFFDVEGESIVLPDDLRDILNRVEIFAKSESNDNYKIINLILKKDKLICRSENESGWIEEDQEIKYDGKELELLINPYQFLQILDKSNNITIGKNRILFRGDNFNHVIALVVN